MIGTHVISKSSGENSVPRIIASKSPGITRTQYRCTGCGCNVIPEHHKPGSVDCDRARDERDAMRWE